MLPVSLLILSTILSWRMVILIRQWALQNNRFDIPNERSLHTLPTPKGGGLAIASMSVILFAVWLIFGAEEIKLAEASYLGCAAIIAALGWLDDQYSLAAKLRLLVQLIIAAIFVLLAKPITELALPGTLISIPLLLAYGINLFWIVGLTNVFNFMDGIDGIAAGQAVIAGTGWMWWGMNENQPEMAILGGFIATASIGFFLLNRAPAQIFMGDVGSTFLGFSFAALPLLAGTEALPFGGLLVFPFIFDSTFTLIRRVIKKENLLKPHRTHLYQRLVLRGYSHTAITSLYAGLAVISAVCAAAYASNRQELQILALLVVIGQSLLLVLAVYTIEANSAR